MSIDQLCMKQECWALEMLGRVGALTQCPHHEGTYVDEGIEESDIYKYAAGAYKKSNGGHPFESFKEMTDAVKSAYEEHGGNDVCSLCCKYAED
ncbi:hypothetical protein QTU96_002061 [Enterobacter asburiae]|uniref:hypothetical protein n=1 Tax=Enterobacter cloacae complex TaxID=354276 RepID=UPI0022725BE1|nr:MULTISPECIES: hypothetical protein [Enterobacter cloacae complex]ELP5719743.1 hypothetical protein [Enterobacter asburiae]EKV8270450.1 hypothetical protein [Enterobacter hormaechei]EKV9063613.1 hypothetical protein [Enterobacter hormaechei]ELC7217078.1 hypothetical protein [Enterobacter hormaechei]MCE1529728.1 hypothetical protein [Enterobacter hormaechei]